MARTVAWSPGQPPYRLGQSPVYSLCQSPSSTVALWTVPSVPSLLCDAVFFTFVSMASFRVGAVPDRASARSYQTSVCPSNFRGLFVLFGLRNVEMPWAPNPIFLHELSASRALWLTDGTVVGVGSNSIPRSSR